MANRLINRHRKLKSRGAPRLALIVGALCAALLCPALPALAQGALADPTQPPVGIAVGAFAPEAAGPVLQSVVIPEKGKPVAVISGQAVRLGEHYGESRLIRLSEREAVFDGPDGRTRLQLTPGIEKTNAGARSAAKSAGAKAAQNGGTP